MAENENKGKEVTSGATAKKIRRAKKVWTEANCKKVAGRYTSEDAWKKGSPSSYKAAAAHKWVKACLAHQEWRQSEQGPVNLPRSA